MKNVINLAEAKARITDKRAELIEAKLRSAEEKVNRISSESKSVYSEVEMTLKSILDIDPKNREALSRLANVYYLQSDYIRAIVTLDKSIRLGNDGPLERYALGECYEKPPACTIVHVRDAAINYRKCIAFADGSVWCSKSKERLKWIEYWHPELREPGLAK